MTGWLIDKSALVRLGASRDRAIWAERIERGLVSVCSVTRLEIGYSARSEEDLRTLLASAPVAALLVEYFTPDIEERAIEVQAALAARSQHRAPSLADLLLAAMAERRRLTILHVDKDFDLIAAVTGQQVETLEM
ncbi:putative nucleic acid-binding protein [Marisediminicola sp. UYEF4]|uniref:PIN domain-containing protein n=1 Tax=Marisediminicola sp. UYEF4 TaxID=1756384 RepID=UPI0033961E71